jgi:hypothetical protein
MQVGHKRHAFALVDNKPIESVENVVCNARNHGFKTTTVMQGLY